MTQLRDLLDPVTGAGVELIGKSHPEHVHQVAEAEPRLRVLRQAGPSHPGPGTTEATANGHASQSTSGFMVRASSGA